MLPAALRKPAKPQQQPEKHVLKVRPIASNAGLSQPAPNRGLQAKRDASSVVSPDVHDAW